MRNISRVVSLALVTAVAAVVHAKGPEVYTEDGLIKMKPPQVDAQFKNKGWTDADEKGFWQRANLTIKAFKGASDPRLSGEGEKWSYPKQMLNYLSGNRDAAIDFLSTPDTEAGSDHAYLKGVDLYWSFTLKGQARKFFMFGDELRPGVKQNMIEGAKIWTAEDPRPNFELILLMDDPHKEVQDYAFDAMKRSKLRLEENWAGSVGDELRAWAKGAKEDRASKIKVIGDLVEKYKGQEFGRDIAKWTQWWADFAQHDWMVLEEVERIMNIKPHPRYKFGRPGAIGEDFSPAARGYWVDARNTDNLRAMRETTVYLMAEAVGNELTRKIYKERIKRFVQACYDIGMGEWDSENYLSHTTVPYHNLYDFAVDPEVKMLAKAFLDWVYTANAMKYYRGGFGGPTKRDYGGACRVFGSSPALLMYIWAGDASIEPKNEAEIDVHAITSAYRPPAAVMGLARKQFKKPVEFHNTKPTYSNWFPGADAKPEFFETMFYSDSYYLGTAVSASGAGDVGAFKLLAYNTARSVDYFLANSGRKINSKNGGDQIAQYRNLCVFLNGRGQQFMFQIPDSAKQSTEDGVVFIEMERTYLALRPINIGGLEKQGGGGRGGPPAGDGYYVAKGGGGVTGFALEIGEESVHKDIGAFKAAVKAKSKLTLDGDKAKLVGTDGRVLEVTYNRENDLPVVMRDGKPRDWSKEFDMYKAVDVAEGDAPLMQGWKKGELRINAAGQRFTQTIDKDGKVVAKFE